MRKLLKKAGIYAAIIGISFGIGALFVLIIIRRSQSIAGGPAVIDQHIDGISGGITEAQQLNTDSQELAAEAGELNQQIGDELSTAGTSIDRLTEASNQLAELVERLQKKAKET